MKGFCILVTFLFLAKSLFAQQQFVDRNGNKRMDVFEDSAKPINVRVKSLLKEMTLEEKIGQMVQYSVPAATGGDPNSPDEFVLKNQKEVDDCKRLVEAGLVGSLHANLRNTPVNTQKAIAIGNRWAEKSRLRIPLLIAVDACHGNGLTIGATVFPAPINIGASFDDDLAYRIANATATESVAIGQNWNMGPNIEVARDMRWGRIDETFGEDPLVVSRMGAATVSGLQQDFKSPYSMAACAKHFIGGSQSADGRNSSPAELSERALQEVFYPPFKACFKAGVASVMLAHNEVNGVPCHSDSLKINQVVKGDKNFEGIIISDYMDVAKLATLHHIVATEDEAFVRSVQSGLDMNMLGPGFYEPVLKAVKIGIIPVSRIDDAVSRILTIKFRLGLFDKVSPVALSDLAVVGNAEHAQLALEAAEKSIVLLKNKANILPLPLSDRIFVSGPFANNQAMMGDWVAGTPSQLAITPLAGIKQLAGKDKVVYFNSGPIENINRETIQKALKACAGLSTAILIVGQNPQRSPAEGVKTEGENIDRNDLGLPGGQLELIKAFKAAGKQIIVVYINGGPLADPWVAGHADGVIEALYPGMMGGKALAEIIYGKINPSAKLPYTVPRGVGYLNSWYYQRPSKFSTIRGKYPLEPVNNAVTPLFEFGYGLSYTSFKYIAPKPVPAVPYGAAFDILFQVMNTGTKEGDEIVQLFMKDVVSSVTTPDKLLIDYKRVHLKPNQTATVTFHIKPNQLKFLNEQLVPELERGEFLFTCGDQKISVYVK